MTTAIRASPSIAVSMIMFVVVATTAAYASHGTRGIDGLVVDANGVLWAITFTENERAVWRSADAGVTWESAGLIDRSLSGLAVGPTNPPTIYAFADCFGRTDCTGVMKTTDAGATWVSAGLPNARVFGVTVDPRTPATLYAYALYAGTLGVFRSTDGDPMWIPTGWPVEWLSAIDGGNPDVMFGGSAYDLLRSADAGATWSVVNTLEHAAPPIIRIASDGTVYAAYSTYNVPYCDPDFWGFCQWFPEPAWVLRSADGGLSWNWVSLGYISIWDLVVHNVSTLYAATGDGVIRSTDDGATWTAMSLTGFTLHLAMSGDTLYAARHPDGLFKSGDGGETWTATGLGPHALPPPPDTAISSASDGDGRQVADGGATLSRTVRYAFTSTADNARFECRLDSGVFAACSSPTTFGGLGLGRHIFEVRAMDSAGNTDASPARYSWTVDASPDTKITAAIDSRGKPVTSGGATTSATMTFQFTGSDNGAVVGFQCRVDGANFAPCTTPIQYTAGDRGVHKFEVRAVDNNGFLDPTPATFAWTKK